MDSDTVLKQGSIKNIKEFYKNKGNLNKILNGYCSHKPINKNIFTSYKAINEFYWFKEMSKIDGFQILNTRVGCINKKILKKNKRI